jgi:ferric-dicitrate binding protein FerR (iron transport regulator)
MNKVERYQSILNKAGQIIRLYQIPVYSDKKDVLNSVLAKINNPEKVKEKPTGKVLKIRLAGFSAAASIAIILSLYIFTATVTFSGRNGEVLAFRLPDNSRMVLLDESVVSIKRYRWNRNVNLEGVAYFEVEKGNNFRVNTDVGTVQVLGTRFLVSEKNNRLNVQCYEGSVKTGIKDNSVVLVPGTEFLGDINSAQKRELQKDIQYPVFAEFNRQFSNSGFTDVIKELETFFGIQIDLQDNANRNFSGTIQTGKLDVALEIICESMQLNYKYTAKNKLQIF